MDNKERKRFLEVGWLTDAVAGEASWNAPRPLELPSLDDASSKAVTACPAVLQHEARIYEVVCPFDAVITARLDEGGVKLGSGSDAQPAPEGLSTVPRERWRHPRRPLIRIATPLRLISDEACYLSVLAPMYDYKATRWPGVVIAERYRLDLWPRRVGFNFEWHDVERSLVLKRGEALFYLRFEGADPARNTRLFEAEPSPELSAHVAAMEDVGDRLDETWSRFRTGRRERPRTLVTRKGRPA